MLHHDPIGGVFMERAIDAIRDEMAAKAKDLNVQYVG